MTRIASTRGKSSKADFKSSVGAQEITAALENPQSKALDRHRLDVHKPVFSRQHTGFDYTDFCQLAPNMDSSKISTLAL